MQLGQDRWQSGVGAFQKKGVVQGSPMVSLRNSEKASGAGPSTDSHGR